MTRACLGALLATAALSAHAQPPADTDRAAIKRVLQTSAADWSRGDLSAFMHSYENAPTTSFVGGHGLITGYDAIQSHYAAAYPAGAGHSMGKLSLSILEYRPLDPAYILVTGRFALTREKIDGGDEAGIFTLLMHHTQTGWRIAYDHTS